MFIYTLGFFLPIAVLIIATWAGVSLYHKRLSNEKQARSTMVKFGFAMAFVALSSFLIVVSLTKMI